MKQQDIIERYNYCKDCRHYACPYNLLICGDSCSGLKRHLQSDQKPSHHVVPRDDRGQLDEFGRGERLAQRIEQRFGNPDLARARQRVADHLPFQRIEQRACGCRVRIVERGDLRSASTGSFEFGRVMV